jgi:hypothetical protein
MPVQASHVQMAEYLVLLLIIAFLVLGALIPARHEIVPR